VPSFAAHQGGRSSINREGTPPSSSGASTTSGHSSLVVDLKISEIVDAGVYVVSAFLPEAIFL